MRLESACYHARSMELRSLLALVLLAALPVSSMAQEPVAKGSPTPTPVPRIQVATPEVDLGVKAVGDPLTAEFSIVNGGKETLELRSSKALPGVRVEGVPAKVEAGKTQVVRVTLPSSVPTGPIEAATMVMTSDPDQPVVRLLLKAKVTAFLLMLPGYARYIVVQQAADGTIAQTVGSADGATFRILRVDSPHPSLRVTFREARVDERRAEWKGSQWRIETTLMRDAPVGPLMGDLVVTTDHPRQKIVRAAVSGFVRPIFAVTPARLDLGPKDQSVPVHLNLAVKNYAEELIELGPVESTVKGVSGELMGIEAGRSWTLSLTFGAEMPAGPFEGKVRIRTASPKIPFIEIPIAGRVVAPVPVPVASPAPAAIR